MNKWDKRFMEMAELVSNWSSCYKDNRKVEPLSQGTKESLPQATTAPAAA